MAIAGQGTTVNICLYDIAGRRLRVLMNGAMPAGRVSLEWDGHDQAGQPVAAGIYFARMTSNKGVRTLRVPLLW